ncbi:MAG TPA: AAA family ATPase [Acidimicrobiales bacterium]|nr:AAA family ATPase [Acidimicrobiales bacterium]
MRLEITLAGDVSVARGDGANRHVLTGPPRVVLAALALSPDAAIDRDRLAGVVWPEAMPRTWASALRTHVSRVRAAVSTVVGAGESVVSGDAGYQLVLPTGVVATVDLDRADQALAAARTALPDDPVRALEQATTAADLVRQPFLAGHPGRWADGIRAHLDDLVVGALEVATQAAIALGDGPRAVAAAEDAVRRAPLRESAHRSLMVALDAAGNRAEALRAYQRLRRSLVEELGIDPAPETDAAYLELLGSAPASRPGRAAADDRPAHAAGAGRSHGPGATPFVGRRAELEVLAAAWDQAAAGGRHLVVVTGEAGIGKSRLTVEAAWRVRRDGGLVLFGRCDQEAIVPYQPLVEALDGLVAATPPDELPFLGDEAMTELGAVLPSLDRPRRVGGPDRARLFGAVTDLVAAVAKERPLLLVLDDLQWADDDTLLLVRHLLRRAGDAPVLVMAISRDHDLEPGHALADVVHSLDRDGWVRRLPLRGLDVAEVRELLGHLHGPGDHGQAARRLTSETAGNPFLVTELARSGGVSSDGDTIPQSVQDLVTTRLHRLDADAVELLRAGAVAGARFDLDIAGRAAGLDDRALLDAVDAALASGLVVEETDAICRFPHDIVRRTLVTHLSGPRRRSLHRRTADAIEELRAHDLDTHAAILAHHTSAGADPAGDRRAVRWARRASAQAAQRSAPAEAVRLCRQALAHLPPGDRDLEAEVTTDLGIAKLAAGDADGTRILIEGATLARRHDRPDVLARAALALADAADDRPELRRQARDLVAAATAAGAAVAGHERSAGADPEPRAEARTRHDLPAEPRTDLPAADAEADARDVQQARLLVRQLRLADEPGDRDGPDPSAGGAPRPPARTLAALHRHITASTDPSAVDERLRLADELALLAVAAGDPAYRVLAAHEQGTAAATLGDEATMRSALASLTAIVDRHGDPHGAALLAERAVAQLTTDGRFEEARQALELAVTAAAAHRGTGGADGAEAVAARHLVVIDWLTGQVPASEPPGGLLAIDEAPGDQRLHLLAVAALAAADGGDPAAATEVRGRLAPYADLVCGLGYRTFLGTATFHLGRLAAVAGDWADAERHLLSALRLHSAWRARPWVALTQHSLAGVLEARGRPSDREWIAGLRAEAAWVTETLGLRSPAASDEG